MKSFKTYAYNMARSKGSMVEGYKMDETIKFFTKYENFQIYHRMINYQNKLGIRWMGLS
jgi:hypothetical protein